MYLAVRSLRFFLQKNFKKMVFWWFFWLEFGVIIYVLKKYK